MRFERGPEGPARATPHTCPLPGTKESTLTDPHEGHGTLTDAARVCPPTAIPFLHI